MNSWEKVFRVGFAPHLSDASLAAIALAMETDDPRLLQGATMTPPPLPGVKDWPVEAACVAAFCGWQGDGLATVAEVEESFAKLCFDCDQELGEPAGCRWFLNWYDDTPRAEMREQLLGVVRDIQRERESLQTA